MNARLLGDHGGAHHIHPACEADLAALRHRHRDLDRLAVVRFTER